MATHNVCIYFKFGFCKFTDKCRFMHVDQVCENTSCEIKLCNLRHPRICKFFRDYNRCKFSEWCAFKHIEKNNISEVNTKEILAKIENLSEIIYEKDILINNLAAKIKLLEEKVFGKEEHIEIASEELVEVVSEELVEIVSEELVETESEEIDMDCTFANPYLRFSCELCDCNAKTKSGLLLHLKAKHKESNEISMETPILDPEIVIIESDVLKCVRCDKCEFSSTTETELKEHIELEHVAVSEKKEVVTEIKLEVFALVDKENVLETRKTIIEKLNKQEDVEEVLKVFVSKVESYIDVNNLKWNKADITLNSKKEHKCWQQSNFRRQIFSKCYLWDSFQTFNGECTREDLIKKREEEINANLRLRGYVC